MVIDLCFCVNSSSWSIERAFRITKGTVEMRPMFHFTTKRIETHVSICFVAYTVYKELERILKISHINMCVDKVLAIAKTIITIKINLPVSGNTMTKTMLLLFIYFLRSKRGVGKVCF
jgi:transposase